MTAVIYLFNYLVFPGFLFAALVGLMSGWLDRKATARIQWRSGPPWYQNFADIAKLFAKDVFIPEKTSAAFLLAPFAGLLSASLASAVVGTSLFFPGRSFIGDIIVVLYLLVMPAVCLIVGASCSRNPLASMGASREMKLVVGYELPFIMILLAVIIRSGGELRLGEILSLQLAHGSNIASASGALGFAAGILITQAKLGFVPFDAAEAEQEIMGGALIEYSGAPLAFFRLTRAVMLYTMPLLLVLLFWGGNLNPLSLAGKYLLLVVAAVLIKNTNPRLRIDQALKFFWGPVSLLALASVILAFMGY